jgi:hypothetical protein
MEAIEYAACCRRRCTPHTRCFAASAAPFTTTQTAPPSNNTQLSHPRPPHTYTTTQQEASRFKDSFQSPPASLEFARGRIQYPPQLEGNPFGRALLRLIGAYGKKQQLSNGASVTYMAITEAAESRQLHDGELQLPRRPFSCACTVEGRAHLLPSDRHHSSLLPSLQPPPIHAFHHHLPLIILPHPTPPPPPAFGLDPDAFMSTHSLLSLHMWLVINRLKPEDRWGLGGRGGYVWGWEGGCGAGMAAGEAEWAWGVRSSGWQQHEQQKYEKQQVQGGCRGLRCCIVHPSCTLCLSRPTKPICPHTLPLPPPLKPTTTQPTTSPSPNPVQTNQGPRRALPAVALHRLLLQGC